MDEERFSVADDMEGKPCVWDKENVQPVVRDVGRATTNLVCASMNLAYAMGIEEARRRLAAPLK